jgi:hypothetical protein
LKLSFPFIFSNKNFVFIVICPMYNNTKSSIVLLILSHVRIYSSASKPIIWIKDTKICFVCCFCNVHFADHIGRASKAWTLLARPSTGIVGSNPIQDMDVCVCVFCFCLALCVGCGLAMGWSPVRGDLPSV